MASYDDYPILPHRVVSAHYPPGLYATEGFSDGDNFVTNMVTIRDPGYCYGYYEPPPPAKAPPAAPPKK